jgi:hypothetical protein
LRFLCNLNDNLPNSLFTIKLHCKLESEEQAKEIIEALQKKYKIEFYQSCGQSTRAYLITEDKHKFWKTKTVAVK